MYKPFFLEIRFVYFITIASVFICISFINSHDTNIKSIPLLSCVKREFSYVQHLAQHEIIKVLLKFITKVLTFIVTCV